MPPQHQKRIKSAATAYTLRNFANYQRRSVHAIETKNKRSRDIEKAYPTKQFIRKLRRLADCMEEGKRFAIQVAGERVYVPADAVINIEHERADREEELEFQIKWKSD